MKKSLIIAVLVLFLATNVFAIEYNEIRLTNSEFEQGKTLEINEYDKIIFQIDGIEYSAKIYDIGVTHYSNDNKDYGFVELGVSENEREKFSNLYSFMYETGRKYEVNYDFKYDVYIKLKESSLDQYRNKTAQITIQKISEDIPKDVRVPYTCAKFYNCPDGERIRYTELQGSGCASLGNPFDSCESEYDNCFTSYYDCENGKRVRACEEVGEEGTFGYGCECSENPEEKCGEDTCTKYYECSDGIQIKECELKRSCVNFDDGGRCGVKCECVNNPENQCFGTNSSQNQQQGQENCPEITPPNCPEDIELEDEKDSNGCVVNQKCKKKLSNGRDAEIKIMPETASERAIERLGELNFTIELKEVGKEDGLKVVYEAKAKKQGRFLGLFKIKGEVIANIDSKTGEIISTKKPWWSFLASGI